MYKRTASACRFCPLASRAKFWADVGEMPRIAVIMDNPGKAEEVEEKGFIGPSMKLMNKIWYENRIKHANLWKTYVLPCRPTDSNIFSMDAEEAVMCCKAGFTEEIQEMKRRGVKVIVAQGATANKLLEIQGDLRKVRGSVYELGGMFVIPTFSTEDCLRHNKRNDIGVSYLAAFMEDWRKAASISENSWQKPKERFIVEPTIEDVRAFVKKSIQDKALIAVDIETTSLDTRRGEIVVVGLATGEEEAISIPLIDGLKGRYWDTPNENEVYQLLDELFQGCDQVYQNCFFDVAYLRNHGIKVPQERIKHDTMVLHALISPETEHNLGFIVSIYGKTAYWKDEFLQRKGTILEMDQLRMREYNLRDCVVLHQVLKPMLADLQKYNLEKLYYEEQMPLVAVVMEMNATGVQFDFSKMESFKRLMAKHIEEARLHLDTLFGVEGDINYDSDDELRFALFGVEPNKFKKLEDFDKKKKGTKVYQELSRLKALKEKAAPRYTLSSSFKGIRTDGGKIAVSKEGLLSYRIALNNRRKVCEELKTPKVEEIAEIDRVMEILDAIEDYSSRQKLLTAFTKYSPDDDKRIRASWLIHGTATGRLSCKQPNLMQLPKEGAGKEIRNFFVAREGWSFISADFVNAEVALLGYDSQDPIIIEIYEQNRNIHDENTKLLFGIEKDHALFKPGKAAAKIFQFGGLSYGGSAREIHRKVMMKAPELKITYAEFERALQNWFKAHPKYIEWKETTLAEVREKRIIYNAFGRMRTFLGAFGDIGKEAMNFRIQSAGANLLNRAAVRLYQRIKQADKQSKFVMQIHDQLVLECPDNELKTVKEWLREEMERPFLMHGRECHVRADVSVGKAFGMLE